MTLETVADGLSFPEGPIWRDGRLLFSDFHQHQVMAVAGDGALSTICEVPAQPSGLGFGRDGAMLVVSMRDQRLLRLDGGGLVEVADLSGLAAGPCNDMAVDAAGRAWIGEFGFDYGAPVRTARLIRVDPDGAAAVVADDLHFPNGIVVTPGGTLIVAETLGRRLTAFDVGEDGSLSGRRPWATFAPEPAASFQDAVAGGAIAPDGICLDAEGAVWVADIVGCAARRVAEGGEVLEVVPVGDDLTALAVTLGGDDGRTLFVCAAGRIGSGDPAAQRRGRILACRVAVPGA
jgi:sugar lactone lactonase YvrE